MAIRITELPELTTVDNADQFVVVDTETNTTKRITRGNLIGSATLPNNSVSTSSIADNAVTLAKLAAVPYKFSALRSTAQNIPAASPTTVIFSTKTFDTSTNYSTTTGRFTAPVAGFYYFDAGVSMNTPNTTTLYISIWKNGTEVKRGTRLDSYPAGVGGLDVHSLIDMAANDYVEIKAYVGVAAPTEVSSVANYFNGYIISK